MSDRGDQRRRPTRRRSFDDETSRDAQGWDTQGDRPQRAAAHRSAAPDRTRDEPHRERTAAARDGHMRDSEGTRDLSASAPSRRVEALGSRATRTAGRPERRTSADRSRESYAEERAASPARPRPERRSASGPERRRDPREDGRPAAHQQQAARPQRSVHTQQEARPRRAASAPAAATATAAAPAHGRRIASLEGLRALAIVSVVLYHLGVKWLPSGHMGVVMFLTLTGYLVASSVIREFSRTGTVSLPRLWLRRLKRIWPAMATMVLVICAACVVCNHVLLTKMRPDILPALLFFPNWNYIVRGVSYFDQIGGPSPLTHLWYLGIDAQMAVVLPVLLLLGLKATRSASATDARRALVGGLALLAVVSAVEMGVLFVPGEDPSRVYYGTDTRAFSVLLGAALALLWPLGQTPVVGARLFLREVRPVTRPSGVEAGGDDDAPVLAATPLASVLGIAALAALVAIMVRVPAESTFLYYGGMVLVTLLSCLLMASLMAPGSLLDRLFSLKPLVWLGGRSYSLYLWHYPIIALLNADSPAPWWLMLVAVAISMGAAELSYRFVERNLGELLGRAFGGLRDAVVSRSLTARAVVPPAACVAVLAVAVIGAIAVPETTLVPQEAIKSTGAAAGKAMDLSQRQQAMRDYASAMQDASAAVTTAADQPVQTVVPTGDITLHAAPEESGSGAFDPVIIGDSVVGAAEDYLQQHAPDSLVDSYVGRSPAQALSVLEDYLAQGVVGKVVVICSFNNNIPTTDQLDQMVADCGDRTIYLVNSHIPQDEQESINAALADCDARYDNVHLIDWNSYVTPNEKTWLYDDGTHLREEYAWTYGQLITNAIAADFIAAGGTADADPNDAEAVAAVSADRDAQLAAINATQEAPSVVSASPDEVAAGVYDPVLIGDSVPGDMDFYSVFPAGLSDSYVGRRPADAIAVYQDYQEQGIVGNVVIFAAFSNTTPQPDQLEQLVAAVDPSKQIFLVGTVNPEGFEEAANENLKACADAHDNVHYVDWPAACAGHESEYLYDDGTHLTPEGGVAYGKMLAAAVAPTILANGGSVA